MADFDDLQLDKSSGGDPAARGPRRLWPFLLLIPLLAVVGYLLWDLTTPEPARDVRVQSEVARGTAGPPPAEPAEPVDLPPLGETDALVRRLATALSSHPRITAWLATDQLLRNFTVVVQNIGSGRTPAQHLRSLRPTGDFIADENAEAARINPRSYRRYDEYADAIAGLDAEGVATAYETLKPRIQEAYRELGYPDEDFDRALERAFAELLRTPVLEGDVALTARSVAWEYADPKLQSLSSAQRQFLRMGPRNVKLIQDKLRELAPHLGLSIR